MLVRPQKGLGTTHFDSEMVTDIWYFDPQITTLVRKVQQGPKQSRPDQFFMIFQNQTRRLPNLFGIELTLV